jgi:hypothetical protein
MKMEQNKRQSVQTPSAEQREKSFRRWLDRKRTQMEQRRADEIVRQYRDAEKIDRERIKRERDKEEKLNEWIKKKEEEIKGLVH